MLQTNLRQSWPARVTAIGFIALILAANLWFGYAFTGRDVPTWLGAGFAAGIVVVLGGGGALLGVTVWQWWRRRSEGGEHAPDEAPLSSRQGTGSEHDQG